MAQLQHSDLGTRMAHALTAALGRGHTRAVVLGSDVPDLGAAVMEAALCALESYQLVLGPAVDGGYYAVGVSAPPHPALFQVRARETGRRGVQAGARGADSHDLLARAPHLVRLQGIEWSTPTVLERSMANARRLGLSVAPLELLPMLPDIDTRADLEAWLNQSPHAQQSDLAGVAGEILQQAATGALPAGSAPTALNSG